MIYNCGGKYKWKLKIAVSVSRYCTIHLGHWFDMQQPDCLWIRPKHLDLGNGMLIALYFLGEGNESLQSFVDSYQKRNRACSQSIYPVQKDCKCFIKMPELKNCKGAPVCFGVCGLFHSPVAADYWSTAGPLLTESLTARRGKKTTLYYNRMEKKKCWQRFLYSTLFKKERRSWPQVINHTLFKLALTHYLFIGLSVSQK